MAGKGDMDRTDDPAKYRMNHMRLYGIRRQKPLLCVCGKSGVGKTTVVEAADLVEIVSYTSRRKRPEEHDGVHYHFRNKAFFEENQHLFRYEGLKIFNGEYYGATDLDLAEADIMVIKLCDAITLRKKGLSVKIIWMEGPVREIRARPEDVEITEEMREEVDHILYNVGDLAESVEKLERLV